MSTTTNSLSAEYEIALTYDIKSTYEKTLIEILTYDLKNELKYYTVPKYNQSAFAYVELKDWEGKELRDGQAHVYFDGSYVKKTFLSLANISDSLEVSLGQESAIGVKRTPIKDFTSSKYIGSNKRIERGYEIVVKNNKAQAITLLVEDQIPVSSNKEIEVELIDKGSAFHDVSSGKLTWRLSLTPNESKTLSFKYTVKHPKNKSVPGL